jgi:hypothetical protein
MHEIVELVKAIMWPGVVLIFLTMYHRQIGSLLNELPNVVRRVRSAHGLGVEIELDKIRGELPIAEQQARSLSLPMPPVPMPDMTVPMPNKTIEGE